MNSLLQKTDCQLVQEFRHHNNQQALETLINRHKAAIYTAIYFLLNKNRVQAEDTFQDVFMKIVDTLRGGKYSEEGKFLPWAMRVAHNFCIDHLRKEKRMRARCSNDPTALEACFDDRGADTLMLKRQTYATLHRMIDYLPESQREIIVLRHYANLSFKEIAALKQCSINTALGRMRYALVNLRKLMVENEIAL